jgi:ADP-heptose:LPS heptosyltransferase
LKRIDIAKYSHPVVFFSNGIGDAFMALPSLRALSQACSSRLVLLCKTGAHARYFSDVALQRVVEMDILRRDGVPMFDAWRAAELIGRCDLFLSLVPWHSPALSKLLALLQPAMSVGFFADYAITLPRDYQKHSSELAFDIPLLLDPHLRIVNYAKPPRLLKWCVRDATAIIGACTNHRILAVHADTAAEKMWPSHCFQQTLDEFLHRHGDFVALVVGKTPQDIHGGPHANRIVPCYGLPLETSCALVAQSTLFLGIDSCMLHVADAFDVPGVGLFGPTSPGEFGFRFAKHVHVRADASMAKIRPYDVVAALEQMLNQLEGHGVRTRIREPVQQFATGC